MEPGGLLWTEGGKLSDVVDPGHHMKKKNQWRTDFDYKQRNLSSHLPCKIIVKARLHNQFAFFITGNASSVAISIGIPTTFDQSDDL